MTILFTKKVFLRIGFIAILLLGLVTTATIVYHNIEGWSWVDAIYFAVITITTVGYGELVPTHDASKLFTAMYSLVSVPLMLLTISVIGEALFDRYRTLGKQRKL